MFTLPLSKLSRSGFSCFSSKTFLICPSDVLSPHLVCSCYSQREPQHLHQCLLSSHCLDTKQHVWCVHHLVQPSHPFLTSFFSYSRGPRTCCYLVRHHTFLSLLNESISFNISGEAQHLDDIPNLSVQTQHKLLQWCSVKWWYHIRSIRGVWILWKDRNKSILILFTSCLYKNTGVKNCPSFFPSSVWMKPFRPWLQKWTSDL